MFSEKKEEKKEESEESDDDMGFGKDWLPTVSIWIIILLKLLQRKKKNATLFYVGLCL